MNQSGVKVSRPAFWLQNSEVLMLLCGSSDPE